MLADLSYGEYVGWLAWLRRTRPYDRDDIHFGILTATIANQWSRTRSYPHDYMPYYDRLEEEITAEELARRIGI